MPLNAHSAATSYAASKGKTLAELPDIEPLIDVIFSHLKENLSLSAAVTGTCPPGTQGGPLTGGTLSSYQFS
ncbi:MAG: hypothetical protein A2508_02550 [Candidatus Lambdaproteobacteria bacterium RIFOXYD12_FULL_49_8]|uniref:Uncharacterized protein n=1 Tax=Candidatus Lambdaproteobacteria bacterium RIFOXYD2_FULL_50_16 TaxID=1817772 RepID=A0A1F6G890_9PROT|nr:MAG: hypothetical protein A2527_00520 [Candidatus Lambdaproteobacteria bacterium RIFOXYD2_FULL_50_16]OGG98265.1 MAG: hypothetical protein A2508_02550 [Candidatus Lambdaproteobacteria bacterium RIFOXYD12_FULL_49_8]